MRHEASFLRETAAVRIAIEFALLVMGSILVGWIVGTGQYFFAGRIWTCGLSMSDGCSLSDAECLLAFFEGGIIGAIVAVPTGLVAWYAILQRKATVAQVRTVVLGSVVGGCVLGAAMGLLSVFATPILTLVLAGVVRVRATPPGTRDPVHA
jgi:hypothetical protein